MKIFVTGGSGFVGGHLIEALAKKGHEVHAMARSEGSMATVKGYGATPIRGDLANVPDLRSFDAVVHAAAFVEEWGTRAQFWEANVEGTSRVLAAGAKRVVHVGTEAAVFRGQDLVDIDETYPYPEKHRYLYSETKAEAERRALAAGAISIRPRLVWGPRDTSVLPAIVDMAKKGAFAWIDGGERLTSTTHVSNLVQALELALTRGRLGEAYFVADDGTRTLRELLTALARTEGVELPGRSLPSFVMRPLAFTVEGLWKLFGARPPLTRFAIDMMSATVTVRTDKARRELGYRPAVIKSTAPCLAPSSPSP
jgi:hypothetical protein